MAHALTRWPSRAPFAAGEAQLYSAAGTCTYAFSKPLLTSSLSVQVHSLSAAARLALATSTGPYQPAVGDIGAPLAGSTATQAITVDGTSYAGAGGVEASGTLALTNSPPVATTSLTVTQTGGNFSWLKVCGDDAGIPAAAATPVPTLSQWGVLAASGLLACAGMFAFSRAKHASTRRAS